MTLFFESAQPCTKRSFFIGGAIPFALILFANVFAHSQTFTVLHSFAGGAAGATPYAGVLLGRDGTLYGTTAAGGGGTCSSQVFGTGCGIAYSLNPLSLSFTALWQFTGGSDGANPEAGLIVGPGGAMFGTTLGGGGVSFCGQYGCGTLFKTPPITVPRTVKDNHWTEKVVYSFRGSDGSGPFSNLATDASGNIVGATGQGGGFSAGVVFRLSYSNGVWTEQNLHEFQGYADGQYPEGGATLDAEGNVYGTTFNGLGYGAMYQLAAASNWAWTPLHIFIGPEGAFPSSGVTLDSSGNVYSATSSNFPPGGGTACELSAGNWSLNPLYDFSGGDGPLLSSLVFDKAGNLYGTTYSDGSVENGSFGTVFKLAPSNGSWTYTLLHEFTGGVDGGYPVGNLTLDANGILYGTASIGGDMAACHNKGCGVVFKITP